MVNINFFEHAEILVGYILGATMDRLGELLLLLGISAFGMNSGG